MIMLSPGFAWIAGGLVLMVLEVFAPGAFMVWIGLAALGAGLATLLLTLSFAVEVVVFAGFAAVFVAIGLRLRRSRIATRINAPGSGLVGRTAHALSFEGREGRVRLGDSDWPARLDGDAIALVGPAPLEVVGVDGMVLIVRPVPGRGEKVGA